MNSKIPQEPPFEAFFQNSGVEKDFNKLPKEVKEKFKTEYLPLIKKYPFFEPIGVGDKKSGQLKDFVRYGFSNNGVEYRVCYKIDKVNRRIKVWYIGTHENCYEILSRRAR